MNKDNHVLVYGTGGLAIEFSSYFSSTVKIIGYFSDNKKRPENIFFNDKKIFNDLSDALKITTYCVVAVGDPRSKLYIVQNLISKGFKFPNFIHPSSIVKCNIANKGIIISPNCIVGPYVNLSNHIYMNYAVGIGHESKLGNFIQINPGAQIGGNCQIGNTILIGSNSTIRQGLKISDNSTISSGSVVFSNVEKYATMFGNPAKKINLKYS